MNKTSTTLRTDQQKSTNPPLKVSIPVKGTVRTEEGVKEIQGRLEAIGEGHARIFFDHPLAEGTGLSLVVEFKDRKNREIQFGYQGKVACATCGSWYEVAVDFDEGVGISGKDAREILSDLFPEEA